MPGSWAVMAETHAGKVVALRRGFPTRDDAEDHPVIARHWRRIWVQHTDYAVAGRHEPVDPTAPFPWSVLWDGGRAYVQDARGRKIATLLGPQARRETVAAILCDLTPVAQEQIKADAEKWMIGELAAKPLPLGTKDAAKVHP